MWTDRDDKASSCSLQFFTHTQKLNLTYEGVGISVNQKLAIHQLAVPSMSPKCSAINPLMPNDHYSGRTAPLTSKRCILYIYSINIGTEYFKHGVYSTFFSLQNAACFIILMYSVPVLFTFYIQGVLKLKK